MVHCLMKEKASAEIALTSKVENLVTNEWKLIEVYVTTLAPYKQASRELCGERYPTLFIEISALHGLHKKLQGFIKNVANRG